MKKIITILVGVLMLWAVSGCATVFTSKVDLSKDSKGNLTNYPKGIRVYPTRVYLVVDDNDVAFESWPDYTCPYDIKPVAVLGTNKFKIELEKGQITTLSSNMDTTASLELIKELVKEAMKGARTSVAKDMIRNIEAVTPPTNEVTPVQVFRMGDDGIFYRVTVKYLQSK